MKLALFEYSNTLNIGDSIQTLGVAQHIDQEFGLVDRDFLNRYQGEQCVVVMNGWFSHEPQNWPPSPSIIPLFFGFHMSPETVSYYEKHKDYFRRFAPIGCRDQATADAVRTWGIESYVSGCATMTFPSRGKVPAEPKTLLVDERRRYFRPKDRERFVSIQHYLEVPMSARLKLEVAAGLLDFYRNEAGLIVTSRIHCAMPCAAMGISVVYTGKREGRTKIIDTIGIPTVRVRNFPRLSLDMLPIYEPSFEDMKQRLTSDLHARLNSLGIRVRMPVIGQFGLDRLRV